MDLILVPKLQHPNECTLECTRAQFHPLDGIMTFDFFDGLFLSPVLDVDVGRFPNIGVFSEYIPIAFVTRLLLVHGCRRSMSTRSAIPEFDCRMILGPSLGSYGRSDFVHNTDKKLSDWRNTGDNEDDPHLCSL